MRIAIIADVHANIVALNAALGALDQEKVDSIYFLGDAVGYCPFPNEVVDLLRERRIEGVLGNYDDGVANSRPQCGCLYPDENQARLGAASLKWTIEHTFESSKEWLRALPKEILVEIDEARLLMFHGSPFDLAEYVRKDAPHELLGRIADYAHVAACLFGHTHESYSLEHEGTLFVNSGSVGKSKNVGFADYAVLDISRGSVGVRHGAVPYDIAGLRAAIRASELPDEIADIWYAKED